MLSFARQLFTLEQPVGNSGGSSKPLGAHMRQVAKHKRVDPSEFISAHLGDAPQEPPEQIVYLWNAYTEIASARGSNGYGPLPIPYSELGWWAALQHVDLLPWEVDTLRAVDNEYLKASYDRISKSRTSDSESRSNGSGEAVRPAIGRKSPHGKGSGRGNAR